MQLCIKIDIADNMFVWQSSNQYVVVLILMFKIYELNNYHKISWNLVCYIYITYCYIFLTFNHRKWLNPEKSEI